MTDCYTVPELLEEVIVERQVTYKPPIQARAALDLDGMEKEDLL